VIKKKHYNFKNPNKPTSAGRLNVLLESHKQIQKPEVNTEAFS